MFKNEKKTKFWPVFFRQCFFREKNRFFPKKTSLFFSSCNPRPDAGESPGLYKPADPASQHHTWTYSSIANSLETGPPSPPRTSEASSSSSRTRTGIVYPLQPRQRRPDVHIDVEAAPQRDDPLPSLEVPTDLTRPAQQLGRKRRRKRSSALYRPAKRSPPRGRWCIL